MFQSSVFNFMFSVYLFSFQLSFAGFSFVGLQLQFAVFPFSFQCSVFISTIRLQFHLFVYNVQFQGFSSHPSDFKFQSSVKFSAIFCQCQNFQVSDLTEVLSLCFSYFCCQSLIMGYNSLTTSFLHQISVSFILQFSGFSFQFSVLFQAHYCISILFKFSVLNF